MATSNQQPATSNFIVNKSINTSGKPIYKKPKTSLFLEKATMIQSGASAVLESQGNGYLTS